MAGLSAPGARVLEMREITKDFPGVRALDRVSFDLAAGEIHALCGENGAGKSTLIKVLTGVYPAGSWSGELLREGRPARFRGVADAERAGLSLIPQELAFVPGMTVAENLVLGREPARFGLIRSAEVRARTRAALARVGLDLDPDARMGDLGVGHRQMVEIARAVARNAAILVLDEPTAALPDTDVRRLLDLLRDLRARGLSAIYVSHRLDEVAEIADRITVLRDGRSVGTGQARDLPTDRVIALMVGRDVEDLYPRPPRRAGEFVLDVHGWTLADPANPGRNVVDGVSFTVRAGEITGIAGLVGAGRTALVASLFGAGRSRPSGTLAVAGGAPRGPFADPGEAMSAGLALLSEDRQRTGLVPEMSVMDNLSLASLASFTRAGRLDEAARRRRCGALIDGLRVRTPGLDTRIAALSGGNQQKVLLGRWLLGRPRVLFLDEPTRGIDVGARAEIYERIGALAADGLGIVLVSSDLPELLGLAHRVLVLAQGRLTAELEGDAATPEAVMAAAVR